MGLPELTFSLEKAAGTVSARMSAGAVALILRDAKDNGVYTIHRESDIPTQLGAANVTAIKRAMIGYINRPSVVYVAVIATAAEISAGFAALAAYSYDYLAGPVDMPASDATTLSGLVKAQRKKRYIGKAVRPPPLVMMRVPSTSSPPGSSPAPTQSPQHSTHPGLPACWLVRPPTAPLPTRRWTN